MTKTKGKPNSTIEIIYVSDASDQRGRRVLIREGGCENALWPGETVMDIDVKVLGINASQCKQIQTFLCGG